MDNYITIEFMGTLTGMILVLNLLLQFFKPLIDKVKKIPTRYVVWVFAIALSVVYQIITGEFSLTTIVLIILNSIVITLAAMKNYDLTISKLEK